MKEKIIFAKNIQIELAKNWHKSRIIIDGKEIPFVELEIKQGQSTDGILKCKLILFPNKVVWIEKK